MGRAPCCDKANVKKGPWSPEEDAKLKNYIENHGTGGNWIALPLKAGLKRCGKSCRLRWLNYLRPNIKHGEFSADEDRIICSLFSSIGSRWSIIAAHLPGRTDNDIKNYWNTKLKKRFLERMDPFTYHHKRQTYPSRNNSFLQNSSLHEPHNNYFTNNPARVFPASGYESISNIPSNTTNFTSNSNMDPPVFQAQDRYALAAPLESNYNNNHQLMIFGNDQAAAASCSSSDGSGIDEDLGFLSYFGSGIQESHKLNTSLPTNGRFSENHELEYSNIEEIKQLISTSSNMCNNLNYLVDEIKSEEQVLYY